MIQAFVDKLIAAEKDVRAKLAEKHPDDYRALVRFAIEAINPNDEYDAPDPKRIHTIDDSDYQGTLVFIIGETGYQPHDYWYVKVGYGSCSGCDALEAIRGYKDGPPSADQVTSYWTEVLHIARGLGAMQDTETVY